MNSQVNRVIPQTMQSARFYAPHTPLRIEDTPIPELQANDVLVEVKACGLCGTDLQFWHGETVLSHLPLVLGHEPSGVVAALGSNVHDWHIGDRVIITGSMPCRRCAPCLREEFAACQQIIEMGIDVDGAFADYVRTAREGLLPLPDAISFEVGAMLGDAIATPYHALTARGHLHPGESVVIWGCGGLGLHAIKLARILGAGRIIAVDEREGALQHALTFGADDIIDVTRTRAWQQVQELVGGADLVVEFVGLSDTITGALRSLRNGGRTVVVGMRPERMKLLPSNLFAWQEYTLIGAFGCALQEIRTLTDWLLEDKLDLSTSVSVRLPLTEINQAFEILDQKRDNPIRVMIVQDE
jgi:propanol-preferring alcohol dehydrogenase